MVDGILILERQIIANKSNEYFASIATKLNNVENPEHEISSPETFKQFMPPSNENSMFLLSVQSMKSVKLSANYKMVNLVIFQSE